MRAVVFVASSPLPAPPPLNSTVSTELIRLNRDFADDDAADAISAAIRFVDDARLFVEVSVADFRLGAAATNDRLLIPFVFVVGGGSAGGVEHSSNTTTDGSCRLRALVLAMLSSGVVFVDRVEEEEMTSFSAPLCALFLVAFEVGDGCSSVVPLLSICSSFEGAVSSV